MHEPELNAEVDKTIPDTADRSHQQLLIYDSPGLREKEIAAEVKYSLTSAWIVVNSVVSSQMFELIWF